MAPSLISIFVLIYNCVVQQHSFGYVRTRLFVVCLGYMGKQLYTTATFHFSLPLQHFFCLLQLRYRCFCYSNTFNVIFWYIQVTHKSFQVPRKPTLITLEINCLLIRSNYVRKLDTISLRAVSLFLGYLFVVRLYNILR